MHWPDELQSPRTMSIALGALGALFSLSYMRDATPLQKLAMVVSGMVSAALFAQPIIDLVNAPDGWAKGIAFLVGLLGWTIMGKLIEFIRKADLWGLFSSIVQSWFSRKG